MRRAISLHQWVDAAVPGDAITDQALMFRQWLREAGAVSELYALHAHTALAHEARPLPSRASQAEPQMYHHSIGSEAAERLIDARAPVILAYHNVTPEGFFRASSPAMAGQLREGRAQLAALREQTVLALADSPYNERELRRLGFERTAVVPIALDEARYRLDARPGDADPQLLFVGRIAPNKRQEDLITLLRAYRRIRPDARLALVGSTWSAEYEAFLRGLARSLGVQDAVDFAGHVSHEALLSHYARAACYVSMSEHEGFGKPLIESMLMGAPVLAFAASAVPETVGGAGILFHRKDYEALAELVEMLRTDVALRQRVIEAGRMRARAFLAPAVRRRFLDAMAAFLGPGARWEG